MTHNLKYILAVFMFLSGSLLYAQEICDNAIDDDGDGLIDINDDDCDCPAFIESSLIPNPSFEDMTCCPNANEMLNCAVDWIQASAATSDYVHTCEGYLGNTSIPAIAPLPFPDGEGGVGFRDGQEFAGPTYKEYIGACLTEPMVIGVTYRLDFYVGFQNNVPGSTSFNMAFFGSTNCSDLPFGGQDFNIGCPVNVGTYTELASQQVSGNNGWVNVVIEFEADQAYEVLILGPSCATNPNWTQDPYFYVDRLAFEEVNEFGIPLEITGAVCQEDLVLSVEDLPGQSYQWYLDGVALIGETNPSLMLGTIDPEGFYLVMIITDDGCTLSREHELRIPPYYAPISATICENETYTAGPEVFEDAGYYEVTLPAEDGCDSIIQLTLDVLPNTYSFLRDTVCEGEVYSYYDLITSEPGTYEISIPSVSGCDSIVELELHTIPISWGVDIGPVFELSLGEYLDLIPNAYDPRLIYFNWYDENDLLLAEQLVIEDYQTFENTILYLESEDSFGCSLIDTVEVRVDKLNSRLYVPNAFSPNFDGFNDFFRFYETIALARVKTFAVFNRWGAEVYREENIVDSEFFLGWDGIFKGEAAAIGVYAYFIEAEYLDGTVELLEGDVTLLR